VRIAELGEATNTKIETIHYYEKAGLLPAPERTGSNYRRYDETHLARLSFSRRCRDLGFPWGMYGHCSTSPITLTLDNRTHKAY